MSLHDRTKVIICDSDDLRAVEDCLVQPLIQFDAFGQFSYLLPTNDKFSLVFAGEFSEQLWPSFNYAVIENCIQPLFNGPPIRQRAKRELEIRVRNHVQPRRTWRSASHSSTTTRGNRVSF